MTLTVVPAGRAVLVVGGPGWSALATLNGADLPWVGEIQRALTQESALRREPAGGGSREWILLQTAPPLAETLNPVSGIQIVPAGQQIDVTDAIAAEWNLAARTGRPVPAAPIRLDVLRTFCQFLTENAPAGESRSEPEPTAVEHHLANLREYARDVARTGETRRDHLLDTVQGTDRLQRPDGVPATDERTIAAIVDEAIAAAAEPNLFAQVRVAAGENFPDDVLQEALTILRTGDPVGVITAAHHLLHEGDEQVAACLTLATAVSACTTSSGLHLFVSGDRGTGKSHSVESWLRQIPRNFKLAGSFSDKSLLYGEIRPGTLIYIDDRGLSDDLQSTIKNATTHFQEQTAHLTLSRDRKPVTLTLPERCVFLFSKVDDPGDDQVLDRCLCPYVDNSTEHLRAISQKILQAAAQGYEEGTSNERQIRVCRAIWAVIKYRRIRVNVPFAPRIRFRDDVLRTPRNQNQFLDLVRGFAVLNFLQRNPVITDAGTILVDATEGDFFSAQTVFRAIVSGAGDQIHKLTPRESRVIGLIRSNRWGEFDLNAIQTNLGVSHSTARQIVEGIRRNGEIRGGILTKCPAVGRETVSILSDDGKRTSKNVYNVDLELLAEWDGAAEPARLVPGDGGDRRDPPPHCDTVTRLLHDCDHMGDHSENSANEGDIPQIPNNNNNNLLGYTHCDHTCGVTQPATHPTDPACTSDCDHSGVITVGGSDPETPLHDARIGNRGRFPLLHTGDHSDLTVYHSVTVGRSTPGNTNTMLPGADPEEFHRMHTDGVTCHRCGNICAQRGGAFQREDGFVLCGDCLAPLRRAAARDLGVS